MIFLRQIGYVLEMFSRSRTILEEPMHESLNRRMLTFAFLHFFYIFTYVGLMVHGQYSISLYIRLSCARSCNKVLEHFSAKHHQ